MEWLNRNVSSSQSSLEERPEIFDSLGMHLPVDVSLRMVNHVMHEPIADFVVSVPFIGVDGGTALDGGQNFFLQGFTFDVGNHLGANFANVTVKHSHYDSLPLRSGDIVIPGTLVLVHGLKRSADKGFIHFDRAGLSSSQLGKRTVLQGEAQTVQYEPR